MLNIGFSTTRQWNPGDEFILFGVRHILDEMKISYNPIIYNRNPSVRPTVDQARRQSGVNSPSLLGDGENKTSINDRLQEPFFDNSMKPEVDYSFIDWIIFAGTPEWGTSRLSDLYRAIFRHKLP